MFETDTRCDPPAEPYQEGAARWILPCLACLLWLTTACSPTERAPLVVFVVIDTLRADALGLYGHEPDPAPRLTALAAEGLLFERVVAPSSWTKTSMASIITSRDPGRHGVRGVEDVLPAALVTLAEAFAAEGWRTVGINTNPWLKPRFAFADGFGHYVTEVFADARRVNELALAALQDSDEQTPTFLSLHYMDVHAPYTPPRDVFPKGRLNVAGYGALKNRQLEWAWRKQGLRGAVVTKRVRGLYQAEIEATDRAFGELIDALEDRGLLSNAVIVVMSDHGEGFLEHGTTEHGWNLYPEVLDVPLVLWGPGRIPEGCRLPAQVRAIDVAPTLLELVGLTPPPTFEGQSLLPFDPALHEDRLATAAVGLNDYVPDKDFVGLVTPEWLYIQDRKSGEAEFYDLRADPHAGRNLGPEHPGAEQAARLVPDGGLTSSEQVELDPETAAHLKALGYLHDDG